MCVGVLVREVFLTGEVADEWAPLERVVIADSATEHGWRDSNASIAEAIVVGMAHFERDLRTHTRQLPDWVGRRTRIVTIEVTLTSRQESPAPSERITSPVLLHQRHVERCDARNDRLPFLIKDHTAGDRLTVSDGLTDASARRGGG